MNGMDQVRVCEEIFLAIYTVRLNLSLFGQCFLGSAIIKIFSNCDFLRDEVIEALFKLKRLFLYSRFLQFISIPISPLHKPKDMKTFTTFHLRTYQIRKE